MPVIPAVGRLSQENREFEVRLLYIEKAIERERERERERENSDNEVVKHTH
jgi:hypothetical protein